MLLQHYTTVECLKNIIENQSLHLNDFRFTNDTAELRYGFKSIYPQIKSVINDMGIDDDQLIELESDYQINTILQSVVKTGSIYLACLCDVTNASSDVMKNGILSMWRSYSNDAHGVAVEFDTDNFLEDVMIEIDDFPLKFNSGVFYGKSYKDFCKKLEVIAPNLFTSKNTTQIIRDAFSALFGIALKLGAPSNDFSAILSCIIASCFFKPSGFNEEFEYRIAISKGQKYFKNHKRFGMVPYVESKINLNKISRVLIGPSLYHNNKNIVSTIEDFLLSQGLTSGIKVHVSEIPYLGR